jgi:PAS domain S-box-containing protein
MISGSLIDPPYLSVMAFLLQLINKFWVRKLSKSIVNAGLQMGQKINDVPSKDKRDAFIDSKDIVDAILNAPIDLALLSKPDGTIVAINQSGADMLHQQSDNLIGIRIFELLSSHEAMEKKAVFEKVIKTGKSASIEGQLADKWFHQNIHPVFDLQGNVRRLAIFSYDITEQKKTELLLREKERELKIQAVRLDELTKTLKILLKKREQDKKEIERNLLTNVKKLLEPFIESIKNTELDDQQKSLLNIIDSNIQEIVSPLTRKLSENLALTSAEIRIANLIKHGHDSKEISKILNISPKTVDTHQKNIRKKIGIDRKKANLRSHLLSMES